MVLEGGANAQSSSNTTGAIIASEKQPFIFKGEVREWDILLVIGDIYE